MGKHDFLEMLVNSCWVEFRPTLAPACAHVPGIFKRNWQFIFVFSMFGVLSQGVPELSMGWVDPRIGLSWVGSVVGPIFFCFEWVGSRV